MEVLDIVHDHPKLLVYPHMYTLSEDFVTAPQMKKSLLCNQTIWVDELSMWEIVDELDRIYVGKRELG